MGAWPGLAADKLMDEEMYPVCAPALLHQDPPLRAPGDLGRVALIHDLSMDGHTGFPTWETWLQQAGATGVAASRGLKINNSAAVLQAAIEGRGVALARSVMARDDLATGRVVRLFPEIGGIRALTYYAVYRPGSASQPRLAAFRDWLMEEAAQQRADVKRS